MKNVQETSLVSGRKNGPKTLRKPARVRSSLRITEMDDLANVMVEHRLFEMDIGQVYLAC